MLPDSNTKLVRAHSLSRRAAIAQMAIIGAIVLCFTAAIVFFTGYLLKKRLAEEAESISHLAKTSLASAVWQVDHSSARDFIEAVLQNNDVVFAEVVTGKEIMALKTRPRFAGKEFNFFRNKDEYLSSTVEIRKYGDWIGSFNLVVSTAGYRSDLLLYAGGIIGLALLLIAAIFLTSTHFTRKNIFAPLKKLEESAIIIADGDLNGHIDTSAPGELGNLARAIDDMRESVLLLIRDLSDANEKLKNQHEMLETMVRERTEELNSKNASLNEAIEELRNAKREAEVANIAKSSFLASMSHEIRTPMNAILGMADILWETQLTKEQAKYVEVFRTAGENLLEILDDILDLSKIEAGHMELNNRWFSLNECMDKLCSIIQPKAEQRKLELTCNISPEIPDQLKGDPTRLRQILINLLGNAVKFTEKGSINLTVETMQTAHDRLLLQFSVRDTGVGVPGDKLSSIFEAFTQADSSTTRQFGGTGLGLTISRELVQMMGGRIWAESTPGQGSTFHFTAAFDISPSAEVRLITDRDASQDGADLPAANILMFEDSKYNAFVIQTYLKGTPCSLTVCANGRDGIEKFKEGSWDLVLMDIQMPVMDGYQATAAIRQWERESGLKPATIIAMTAYALNEDAERCLEAGADHHLPKPVKKSALFEAIRRLAAEKQA
ncbi:MAG: response regulator [Desulfovibrionaceae bacterium]|nr:response regulator [Desulfovibrionaceae bacterium]